MKKPIAVAFLLGIVMLFQISCGEQTPEEVEVKIATSEKLRQIDKICRELPKPQSFRQVKKGISGNASLSSIEYRYVSDQPFAVVRDFYIEKASDAGYALTGGDLKGTDRFISDIRLDRDGVAIVVENRPPSAIYNIGCVR